MSNPETQLYRIAPGLARPDATNDPARIPNPAKSERAAISDLSGYGYHLSDNDCHIHGKPEGGYVNPEEHKEEEFFAAAAALLDARPLAEPSAG